MAKEPVKTFSQNSDPVLSFRIVGTVQVQEKLMMYTVILLIYNDLGFDSNSDFGCYSKPWFFSDILFFIVFKQKIFTVNFLKINTFFSQVSYEMIPDFNFSFHFKLNVFRPHSLHFEYFRITKF